MCIRDSVTAERVTTERVTTERVTTKPERVTTERVTAKRVTTERVTTKPERVTTKPERVTTERVTTERVTTECVTTERVTAERVTTERAETAFLAHSEHRERHLPRRAGGWQRAPLHRSSGSCRVYSLSTYAIGSRLRYILSQRVRLARVPGVHFPGVLGGHLHAAVVPGRQPAPGVARLLLSAAQRGADQRPPHAPSGQVQRGVR
eukprot:8542930-Pyramimonas_sp.AAC.1